MLQFSIIVLETLIGLWFFCLLGGGLFGEFDLFWDLLLFCLFGWFFLHGGLFAVSKAGLSLASDQELPLLCWLCPRGVVVRSSSEHTWAMFLQGLQAVHCSPVVSNSPNF